MSCENRRSRARDGRCPAQEGSRRADVARMATAAVVETRTRPPLPRLSWRLLLVFAALSTVACAAMVIPANVKTDQGTVALVSPAADGPSTGVFRGDFPNLPLEPGLGADGQMFYAV